MRGASHILLRGVAQLLFTCLPLACGAVPAAPTATRSDIHEVAVPVTAIPGAPGAQSAAWLQQRIPRQAPPTTAALEGILKEPGGRGLGGVTLTLRNLATGAIRKITTSAEGVFRVRDLPPGMYELKPEGTGFDTSTKVDLRLEAGEVVTLELVLQPTPLLGPPAWRVPRLAEWGPPAAGPHEVEAPAAYRQMRTRVDVEADLASLQPEELPSAREVFLETPDRWNIPMPEWDRYGKGIDAPYKKGHWWDPFNRNKFKGDVPIFGQRTFFHFTAVSETLFDARRLPVPSNVSTARPGSSEFFGKGEQALLEQTFRFTFDLFRGDAAFRPADWRIRVTPAINVNYLKTRELGIANVDVRRGTNRLDAHAGLQEAFLEVKLRDLSTNYDFLSVRAGIQGFTSDFRGFLFVEEQPGVRLFGNLHSNRWEYNLAYFHFLEKDTNSGLNTFARRHQQVLIANVYRQDFIWPGYTAQFSVHFNKDDASLHFDENGFLVRPAPIGAVRSLNQLRPHNIRAAYLGWAGNGHIGRLNLSHAFYQALGRDDFNTIAGRPVTINAQMAALELSVDKDWARLRTSFFWASGDADPRDGRARGFDAIQDFPAFAGGVFSLWNREGIRLSGSGVALTPPHTLLPSLRSSKDEGQANFVNPGLFLYNAGAAFDLTPKLRGFVHVNFLRFDRTEPLELLLFQAPIRHNIGLDYGFGVQYRPPLTENITLTGGAAALAPGRGFQDIYTGKTLFSLFANVRFLF